MVIRTHLPGYAPQTLLAPVVCWFINKAMLKVRSFQAPGSSNVVWTDYWSPSDLSIITYHSSLDILNLIQNLLAEHAVLVFAYQHSIRICCQCVFKMFISVAMNTQRGFLFRFQ